MSGHVVRRAACLHPDSLGSFCLRAIDVYVSFTQYSSGCEISQRILAQASVIAGFTFMMTSTGVVSFLSRDDPNFLHAADIHSAKRTGAPLRNPLALSK